MGVCNYRELTTMAHVLDLIFSEQIGNASDYLVQRFHVIEHNLSCGDWSQSLLLELVPGNVHSLPTEGEQPTSVRNASLTRKFVEAKMYGPFARACVRRKNVTDQLSRP